MENQRESGMMLDRNSEPPTSTPTFQNRGTLINIGPKILFSSLCGPQKGAPPIWGTPHVGSKAKAKPLAQKSRKTRGMNPAGVSSRGTLGFRVWGIIFWGRI